MSVRSPATRSGIAWPRSSPSNRLTTLPLSETTSWPTNGAIRRPPLAMVAATDAICRGETRTSRWPMALWAVGDDAGRRRELVRAGLVEAELPGLGGQLLAAQTDPQAGEGGVAGDLQRLGQGQLAVAAARAAEVADVGRGLGHVQDRRGG